MYNTPDDRNGLEWNGVSWHRVRETDDGRVISMACRVSRIHGDTYGDVEATVVSEPCYDEGPCTLPIPLDPRHYEGMDEYKGRLLFRRRLGTRTGESRLTVPVMLDDGGMLPSYAHDGDAGADLRSIEDVTLEPFTPTLVHTGVHVELPEGTLMWITPRSGLAIKHGISIVNAPGLIDSGYRGEIMVALINLMPTPFDIKRGERIAQAVVQNYHTVEYRITDALGDSERGDGGFGSTGTE